MTLLEHFKSYLKQNSVQCSSQPENLEQIKVQPGSVYVKKWMRTSHAIMFRLSNKIVQVNFKDHTEILLNSESRYVTYVNKKGERSVMPLSQALESNDAEMTKRLKYTKDILTTMLNNGGQALNGGNSPKQSAGQPLNTFGSRISESAGMNRNPSLQTIAARGNMMQNSGTISATNAGASSKLPT